MIRCPTRYSNPWECPGREAVWLCRAVVPNPGGFPLTPRHRTGDPSSAIMQGRGRGSEPFPHVPPRAGSWAGSSQAPGWHRGRAAAANAPAWLEMPGRRLPGLSASPPPAHELAGFLGLSLTREMSPRAENSPAEPCQGTSTRCYSCSAWGRVIL